MRRYLVLFCLGCASLGLSRANTVKPVTLTSANDLGAWEFVATPSTSLGSVCHFSEDGTLKLDGKPIGYIATKKSFDNYRLHVEWRWPTNAAKNSNSGVLLHIASGPKDRAWPECFQVQTKPSRAGDLLPMAGAVFAEKLSTPPEAKTPQLNHRKDDVEKPLGEWNTADITCHNGVIEITINGVVENKVTDASPGAGKIGFQFEGTPYALRNVRLTPLD